jgi:phosphate transport system protein
MTHYEERLGRDLKAIREQVAAVGREVEDALRDAVRAFLTASAQQAAYTILGDLRVNRETREIDRLCHIFVARHLPSAGNLRFVSSVLRLSIILERIGDYAATIGRSAAQLSETPPSSVARDIEMMGDQSTRLLHQAMKSFNELNADMARGTSGTAGYFTRTSDKVFADLVRAGEKRSRPIMDLFSFLATVNRLERAIHQAKNICEETIFVATGETKPDKKFDVLFLDETNSIRSRLAEAYARKAFPDKGTFQSAGWKAAESIDPHVIALAHESGLDLEGTDPTSLDSLRDQLSEYNLIVSMMPGARQHIPELPFHTILLEWDIPAVDPADETALADLYKTITHEVSELVQALAGGGRLTWTGD